MRVLATFATTDQADGPRVWRTITDVMGALNDAAEEAGRPRVWTPKAVWRRITSLQAVHAVECNRAGFDDRLEQAAGRRWRIADFGIETLQRHGYISSLRWLPDPMEDETEATK